VVKLQSRHHRANERIFLYAFDLIELNGDDLRRDPLEVRKATLASIVAKASKGFGGWTFSTNSNVEAGKSRPSPESAQPNGGPPTS
jgi:ATP-dependent DNA ligase